MKTKKFFQSNVKLFFNDSFKDSRGFFYEFYKKKNFNNIDFVQDNISYSKKKGTLRGLHFQTPPYDQVKLIQVIRGKIFDVVVDLRKNSKTYGMYKSFVLDDKIPKSLFISSGFAHGFITMSDNVKLFYKVSNYYSKKNDYSIRWDDKIINIKWPIKKNTKLIISDKDKKGIFLENFQSPFI